MVANLSNMHTVITKDLRCGKAITMFARKAMMQYKLQSRIPSFDPDQLRIDFETILQDSKKKKEQVLLTI